MGDPSTSVLDVYDTIASAMTTTPAGTFHWHLLKQDGQWRILHYLQSAAAPAARDLSSAGGTVCGCGGPATLQSRCRTPTWHSVTVLPFRHIVSVGAGFWPGPLSRAAGIEPPTTPTARSALRARDKLTPR